MIGGFILAVVLTTAASEGCKVTVEAESAQVDPAKPLWLTLTMETAKGVAVELPDLGRRTVGFSLAEDDLLSTTTNAAGSVTRVVAWRLVPEPDAEAYKLRPMVVTPAAYTTHVDFSHGALYASATGEMSVDEPKEEWVWSWALAGKIAAGLALAALLAAGIWWLVRLSVRKVREHFMSPIERAWVELDRLLKKGLPGRGRYKDFYVELTMVVRRYIQRKYGIKAPHLTTEEFLREAGKSLSESGGALAPDTLKRFLESADLIKFAGVEATPDMADEATASARSYLTSDASNKSI